MGSARRGSVGVARRAGAHRLARPEHFGGAGVAELQRARMLHSAVQIVMEQGYRQMSVARVTNLAGVSRRTFYEVFEDREACFLAAFDQAIAELRATATTAWEAGSTWPERVRAALGAMLDFLDQEPGVASLLIIEALGAGPKVLAQRAGLIAELADAVDQGRTAAPRSHQPPTLTAEGLVGAVLGVIHTRLLESPRVPLASLRNQLVGMVLAPYLGVAVAARELEYPMPPRAPRRAPRSPGAPLRELNMRVTYRTLLVLAAIGERPGASNRQIATAADVTDQGQISRLLARLEGLGLIHNTTPSQPTGEPNQWHLTNLGQEVQSTTDIKPRTEHQTKENQ
jgi:AcrR family transcriptional regulator